MGRLARCTLACLVLLGGLVSTAPAGAEVPALPVAQERYHVASQRADRAAASAVAREQVVADARARLTAARAGLRRVRAEHRSRVAASAEAASAARRATIAKNAADGRAELTRADVQRMARSAYMHSSTGGELAVMIGVAAGGPTALRDLAAGDLVARRVQDRVLLAADAARAQADAAARDYERATREYSDALARLTLARDALDAAQEELLAAAAGARLAAQAARSARRAERRASATLAQSRATLARARRIEARRAALAPGSAVTPLPPGSAGNQAPVVWRILRGNGFSEAAAAGILGNLQQESNIDPTCVQNGGPGMGLAQWSRGGRWDTGPNSLLAYAAAAGLDPWDTRTQTRFMIVEMSAGWGGFDLAAFQRMTDVVGATVYFHDVFERSADSAAFVLTVRGGYALHWYQALAGT